MKLRTQHVSNSSSSSFYMFSKEDGTFTDRDKCIAFVKKFLAPYGPLPYRDWNDKKNKTISEEEVADQILSSHSWDIKESLEDVQERIEMYGKWAEEHDHMRNFALERMQQCEDMERYAKSTISFAYISWADEDGAYFSALEHNTEPQVIDGEGVIRQSNH